jgi:hypothetical protein
VEIDRRQAFASEQLKKLGPNGPPELIEYYRTLPLIYLRERDALPISPKDPPLKALLPPETRQLTDQSTASVASGRLLHDDEPALPEGLSP